jgi:hypothetical protein
VDDLISRQAAIDAIENTDWYHQNANNDMVSGANPDTHQAWYKAEDVYKALESVPSAQPERMTNRQWIGFLSAQFDISRKSAKEMLHGMMQCKKEDNFKKMFNGGQERS